MLHKVLPNVLCQIAHFLFVDRLKSTHWSKSKQSCEAGSLHTKITDFFPLLSHSGLCFRCPALHLHTTKLNCNGEQTLPFTKMQSEAQTLKPYRW